MSKWANEQMSNWANMSKTWGQNEGEMSSERVKMSRNKLKDLIQESKGLNGYRLRCKKWNVKKWVKMSKTWAQKWGRNECFVVYYIRVIFVSCLRLHSPCRAVHKENIIFQFFFFFKTFFFHFFAILNQDQGSVS
jgi:hypothetical protein